MTATSHRVFETAPNYGHVEWSAMRYRVIRHRLRVDNWTSHFFGNMVGAKTPFHRRCGFLSVLPGAYLYLVCSRILYKLRISKARHNWNQIAFAGYVGHGTSC